jgi:hypothetical protein
MSREQIVRDTAYAIWEAEGKPEGRDADHWRLAEARVAASLAPAAGARAKAPAKGKATTKPAEAAQAKPPAKTAATKAAPKAKSGAA